MERGKSVESQIRLEVSLIHVPAKETLGGVMDVDPEAVRVSVSVELSDPTSTDGRDVDRSPSLQSAVSPTSDGPSEMPKTKKRRVMFADE